MSRGIIVGIDIDENELKKLDRKIIQKGLSSSISTRNGSIMDIDFPDKIFDIIWAEGSLHLVGFEKGFKKLRSLLQPKGFLVVHDGVNQVSNELKNSSELGFRLINSFRLPEKEWQIKYFDPLELLLNEFRKKAKRAEDLKVLEKYQNQVNIFRKNPKENISGFYVFQKTNSYAGA